MFTKNFNRYSIDFLQMNWNETRLSTYLRYGNWTPFNSLLLIAGFEYKAFSEIDHFLSRPVEDYKDVYATTLFHYLNDPFDSDILVDPHLIENYIYDLTSKMLCNFFMLLELWQSDNLDDSEEHPPKYFIEWALSKHIRPEWLDWAIENKYYILMQEAEVSPVNFAATTPTKTVQMQRWRPAFSYESDGLNALYDLVEKYYFDENGPIYDKNSWPLKKNISSNYLTDRAVEELDTVITSKQRKTMKSLLNSAIEKEQFLPLQLNVLPDKNEKMRPAFLYRSAGLDAMYDLIEKYFFDGDVPIYDTAKWEIKSKIAFAKVGEYSKRTKDEVDTAITSGKRKGKGDPAKLSNEKLE